MAVIAGRAAPAGAPPPGMSAKLPHRLPGDRTPAEEVARMLRVDHAGEFGATRIYEGQLAVLGRSRAAAVIREMGAREQRHLALFEELLRSRRVRPTALHPVWSAAGFALGAATALLGRRAAMACTVAVEEVIDEHYRDQAERLAEAEPALVETILACRADELAHRDTALAEGAAEAPLYEPLTAAIKAASRLAIWLSTRI
jgi:ubiquinone biosynthesis monooxygenase Coq7